MPSKVKDRLHKCISTSTSSRGHTCSLELGDCIFSPGNIEGNREMIKKTKPRGFMARASECAGLVPQPYENYN